ncbi:MAG: hypothetical protein ABIH23_35600 [bacterium]
MKISSIIVGFILLAGIPYADDNSPLLFDTSDHGDPGDKAPIIQPWRQIELDPEYSGHWVVTGDVDGDGAVDIVSARNVDQDDVHYTSAVVAQRLDGSVIWKWGDPKIGRRNLHHDVACQIYDWDGDGKNEVILCTKGFLVELDGTTGEERRRIPIAEDATDCVAFVNISGEQRATDVLVKTRYTQIWAYDRNGQLLWTVKEPGGYRTAHQALPIDLDGDGKDEILAGYAILNPDGTVRWTFESKKVDLRRGHADCWRILREGNTPEEYRLALTCCGANNIALVDGNGKTLWEVPGHHFESVNVGKIYPEWLGSQILVDIDHVPKGESPVWVFSEDGTLLGRLMSDYCRHHKLLDWTGDGYAEIILAYARGVFDRNGKRIATFDVDSQGGSVMLGDMTGDGIEDITICTPSAVHIFKNENGKKSKKRIPLGCGVNFTYD